TTRRRFLQQAAAAGAALSATPALAQRTAGRVVVVGGGFAGATCARTLKRLDPKLAVTLIEPSVVFTACPFSNEVVAGLRQLREQQFGYAKFPAGGVAVVRQAVAAI